MPEKEGEGVDVNSNKDTMSDVICTESSAYRNEIIETIDTYQDKLKNQRMNKNKIKNRLKLLQMREKAHETKNLAEIEKELWAMAVDIEAPNLRMQRNISVVIILYTCLAVASFVILTVTEAILLPSFNVPYSVLLMGLIGSLVSMYVKLPGIRKREPWNYDSTVWFIISPPVAVIMAGICFGIVQIILPVFQVGLSDESWLFWILAWMVGFVNWVYLYERLSGGLKKSMFKAGKTNSETAKTNDQIDNGTPR
ncbi:MAG: hypothetical protein JSU83_03945 [Deltaproteobacteria bacterium]|nr:MAG: hypothetical protein JSU83_03945 [Deltaproteobacteria bacterium]